MAGGIISNLLRKVTPPPINTHPINRAAGRIIYPPIPVPRTIKKILGK